MRQKRIIINADDCGISHTVNEHIEKAILAGRITSTTVMANMDDFEGAIELYKKYSEDISFGWHVNLTQGAPLLYSQLLLDKGFYEESGQGVVMNGRKFMRRWLSLSMRQEIKKELLTQYTKLRDNGINISHIDSHHHIHTSVWALALMPEVLKETGVKAMRNIYNNVPRSFSLFLRKGWAEAMKLQVWELKMPDVLCGFEEFVSKGLTVRKNIIELECHPGHPKYAKEESLLFDFRLGKEYALINYRRLFNH